MSKANFWEEVELRVKLPAEWLAAGVVQHAETRLFQTYLSLYSSDINLLTAHNCAEAAETVIRQIGQYWQSRPDSHALAAFLVRLPADAEPQALPQWQHEELLETIELQILHHLVEKPETVYQCK